jgi:serine/threonine-protein kinase
MHLPFASGRFRVVPAKSTRSMFTLRPIEPDKLGLRLEAFAKGAIAIIGGSWICAAIIYVATGYHLTNVVMWIAAYTALCLAPVPMLRARAICGLHTQRMLLLDAISTVVMSTAGTFLLIQSEIGVATKIAQGLGVALDLGMLGATHRVLGVFFVVGVTIFMVAHAALIPTSPLRRSLVTAALFVPFALIWGLPLFPAMVGPALSVAQIPAKGRWDIVVWTAMLLVLAVAAATFVATVVHRLETRVARAEELGQYRLEEKLGEGGMGVVYRASHAMMRRPTALKLLPPEKAGAQSVARFEREVQLTCRLTHPNTVTIYDYGCTPEGTFYYAMELLEGADIHTIVDRTGPMPAARVAKIMASVAGALAEAHGLGLVHRDIKPSNVYLCRERGAMPDVVKVLDFGLVKTIESTNAPTLSQEGAIPGTPMYMAPEAFGGGIADPRSDIYALGGTAYFMLTGRELFEGTNLARIIGAQLYEMPNLPSVRRGAPIAKSLEDLVMACLSKKPEERPQSALELIDRLQKCADLGVWSDDDARQWWSSISVGRESIQVHVARGVSQSAATEAANTA